MRRERGAFRYRRLQVLGGYGKDAYRPDRKPRGPLLCRRCGAAFRDGRWSWKAAPAGAKEERCPACQRIDEDFPAGYVSIGGSFFAERREEVLARIRHCETQENAEHPLERIMKVDQNGEGAVVTTTSTHLARLIGHALQHAFKGDLKTASGSGDNLVRISWSRAKPPARKR